MLGLFFCYSFGGPFLLSSLSRDDGDNDDDEWETYMSTRNGIFSFPVIYILCSEQIFFSFSPTQEVIRVKIAMLALLLLL